MKTPVKSIDDYLASVSPEHRFALARVRSIVRKSYPKAEECFYYRLPAFRLNGKAFIAFRAARAHCSLHPLSGTVIPPLKAKLGRFAAGKGTLRFTPEKPIPASLIKAVLRARAQELRDG